MLRKLVLPVLGLVTLPAIASAQFEAGDLELTLSANSSVSRGTREDLTGGSVEFGYFAKKELELGVRETIQHFSTTNSGSSGAFSNNGQVVSQTDGEGWRLVTLGFADYHFDLGKWQPFVGVFGGYDYTNTDTTVTTIIGQDANGNAITDKTHPAKDSIVAGPEVGVKYFVNGTTFLFARAGYVFWFNDRDQDTWDASLGVGFRF